MNKNIIIVGANGLGREIFLWLVDSGYSANITGFISDFPEALDNYNYPCKIVGDIESHKPLPNTLYVMALMNPATKRNIVERLKDRGCQFMTFIHPSVIVSPNSIVGNGSVITPGCIVSCDVEIGDFVFLNTNTTLGHDVKVGDYTSINGKVEISGFVDIGEEVTIGSRSVVLPRKKIASGATVGAGSVVVGNIKKPITVFGNPAKRI